MASEKEAALAVVPSDAPTTFHKIIINKEIPSNVVYEDEKGSSSSSKQVTTNWLELPLEVISLIFTKVGAIDILLGAQAVCSTWRKICKEPHLFRSIDICDNNGEYNSTTNGHHKIMKLAKEAVNRSCGQLVDFSIDTFATDDILELIIAKNSPLRRLQFSSCLDISDNAVIDMAKKLPLLEELEISYCDDLEYPEEVVETFGRFCHLLKSFTLKQWDHSDPLRILGDKEALVIAQSMPQLLHLNLSRTCVTENGLRAILDGCPHINFLDLSWCTNLNFAWGWVKMCVDRNIKLRILNVDSIDKLITRMIRQLLSILKEYVKLIQDGELESGCSGVNEFEAFCNTVEDLEASYDAVEDLESGYTTKLFANSGSNKVLLKVLLNELTQMQSILSVFLSQENILLISEAVEEEQNLEVVMAQLQDLVSRTSHMMDTICSFIIPWLNGCAVKRLTLD